MDIKASTDVATEDDKPTNQMQMLGPFRLVRPLVFVTEEVTSAYAAELGVPLVPCGCSQKTGTVRRSVRDMFGDLERRYPHLKENILSAMGNIEPQRLLDTRFLNLDGGGTLTPRPANCDSSGVHRIVKSHRPCNPVLSTTGRSRTANCMTPAKSPIVAFITGSTPRPLKSRLGRPLGLLSFFVSLCPPGPTTMA